MRQTLDSAIESTLIRNTFCLAALLSLANCGPSQSCESFCGLSAESLAGNAGSSGAQSGAIGLPSTGGTPSSGGTGPGSPSMSGGGGEAKPTSGGTGGTHAPGGTNTTGGVNSTAGATARAGTASEGGAQSLGGFGGARVDAAGVPLAKPGDESSKSRGYLNLGDLRLINNRWGSDELGCNTTQRVFVNGDRTIGWEFKRPSCGGSKTKPDYPEIEFGVGPFGANSHLLTTPPFSSTALLPKQIKDIVSGSAQVDGLSISLSKPSAWNISFELWLSERNPVTDPNPGVFAEIIVFWGWETGRWPCDQSGTVKAGSDSYRLCHQSDRWANGWRFYQFNVDRGPLKSYSATVDAKALIDWVVNTFKISRDLWVTRFEVGSEIDDDTSGSVTLRNLTFEVNGSSRSVELAP